MTKTQPHVSSKQAFLLLAATAQVFMPTPALGDDPTTTTTPTAKDSVASIFDSVDGVSVGGSLLAVAAMIGGVVMCVSGFKLFRPTLFGIGFIAGGTLLAIAVECIFESKSWLSTASWIGFLVGGVLCGCLVTSMYSLGIFVAGATGGVVLATLVHTSFGYSLSPSHPSVALLVLGVVFGLLGGVLALRLEKPVLIVATSIVGASVLVWGVGYFAGDFPNATDLTRYRTSDASTGKWVYSIPSAWWVYAVGMLLIAFSGVVLQSKLTGKGVKSVCDKGEPCESAAVPRKHVVMFARRDLYEVDLGTPKTSDSRSGYAVAHV